MVSIQSLPFIRFTINRELKLFFFKLYLVVTRKKRVKYRKQRQSFGKSYNGNRWGTNHFISF